MLNFSAATIGPGAGNCSKVCFVKVRGAPLEWSSNEAVDCDCRYANNSISIPADTSSSMQRTAWCFYF